MPGPKSQHSPTASFPPAKPNRKSKARLKARREDYDAIKFPTEHGFDMHRPGSQNRKK